MVNSQGILIALRRIMRAVVLHSKKLEKEAGLTVPQILILQAIRERGSLPINQIARGVSLSQATVASVLHRLEKKDLLRRDRDPQDRRVVSISLTQAGKEQLENAPGLLQEDFVARFDELESWEQKMLTASVERVASMMEAHDADASPILQVGEIDSDRP